MSDDTIPNSGVAVLRPRVLIVDDEKSILVTLGEFVEQAGFDVLLARNGLEALRIIEERHPDVVVTDIVMPEEDGLGVIRQMHTRFPDIPFVVMSGASFASDVHLSVAKAFGAASVLRKPFDRNELVEVLRRIVAEGVSRPGARP
jgi:CheY-like chemotaxis protein